MKAPRFTLDQLRPGLQEQVVASLHPQTAASPAKMDGKGMVLVIGQPAPCLPLKPRKRGQRVARPRNGGTWTEARYWGALRSHLRRLFRFWKPAQDALKAAQVGKGRFFCADCGKVFRRKGVQIDHVEACGQLTSPDHLAGFLARLTPESPAAFKIRCKSCHQKKTDEEREARTA